jgi:hypothetical protein
MNSQRPEGTEIPNGPAAAAIVSAAVGCFCVSAFGWLGDAVPAMASFFNFYNPTGALSGVTTLAILVWLVSWAILSRTWGEKSVAMGRVNVLAYVLLGAGLLLSFPPFGDLLRGK